MAYDEVKRWVLDHVSSDERFPEHPKKAIERVEKTLPDMKPEARDAAIVYLKQYANAYYLGKHNMQTIPEDVRLRVNAVEVRATRANLVDKAHEYLDRMGPPSKVLGELGMRVSKPQGFEVRPPDGPAKAQQKVLKQQHGNVIAF